MKVLTFDGDNILFELTVTVVGNHAEDSMWVRSEAPSSSSNGGFISSSVVVEVWRGISNVVYYSGTNTTVFLYRYSYNNSYYEAGPKLLGFLLFPWDKHDLTLYFSSSFNASIDPHPSVCSFPSQNYQDTFQITPISPSEYRIQLEIQHSPNFVATVAGMLYLTIAATYALSFVIVAFLVLIFLRKRSLDSIPNIIPVSSAIIFFVPAFEIAFSTLRSPLPLTFADMLLVLIIPLNATIIGSVIWFHYFRKEKNVA